MSKIIRDDMKIKFHGEEIDLSFANEIIIEKKQNHMDKVTAIIYIGNENINIDSDYLYILYKGKKYILTDVKNMV